MASRTLIEPAWLTARRERAVGLRDSLKLPSFRGTPGWEFTSLKKLDLDAFEKPERIGAHLDIPSLGVVDAPAGATRRQQVDHALEGADEAPADGGILDRQDEVAIPRPEVAQTEKDSIIEQ